MPISNSDIITSQIIREELGLDPGTPFTIGDAMIRELTGIASGPVNLPNDFKGKSAVAEGDFTISAVRSSSLTGFSTYHTPPFGSEISDGSFNGYKLAGLFSYGISYFYVALQPNSSGQIPPDNAINSIAIRGYTLNASNATKFNASGNVKVWMWVNPPAALEIKVGQTVSFSLS